MLSAMRPPAAATARAAAPPWRGLLALWPRRPVARRPQLRLAAPGLAPATAAVLQQQLGEIGRQIGLELQLVAGREAELVLLDLDYASTADPAEVAQHCSGRPRLLIEAETFAATPERAQQQQALLRQLCALPLLRQRLGLRPEAGPASPPADDAPSSLGEVFDSGFDPLLVPDPLQSERPALAHKALIGHFLRGLADAETPPLAASYGAHAGLRVDFAARSGLLDPLALQGLRVRRELPQLVAEVRLCDAASELGLEELAWHLGVASARYPLLGQPDDPWNAPLQASALDRLETHSRQPRHLELARLLQAGPLPPVLLRRQVRVSVPELRSFLQPCLFLGLLRWA